MTEAVESLGTESEAARDIARVAARLFAAQGYDATSVREIVEAAGVQKPTLYYHFHSKEGLAQALLTRPLARLAGEMRAILEGPGDPVRKLDELIAAHFDFTREDPDRSRFLFALFFGPLGASLSAELTRSGNVLCDHLRGAAGRLAEAGLIPADRAEAFSSALWGVIISRTIDYLYKGQEFGPGVSSEIVGDLLWGFGTPEARRRLELAPTESHSNR